MKCLLDGQCVDVTRVGYREMGSGGVPEALLYDAKLVFSRDEFVALLSDEYADLVRELVMDVANVGGATDYEKACLAHGDFAVLLDSAPAAVPAILRVYLWNDLRRLCFDANPIEVWEYVVDEFRGLELAPATVTVMATAYHVRPFEQGGKKQLGEPDRG